MNVTERFLKYVSFDTQSNENVEGCPSTSGQRVFAEYLKTELDALGLSRVTLNAHGYLTACLPGNLDKNNDVPAIGFIAHLDTSPDLSGKQVYPRIISNYDGSDIVLCAQERTVLSPAQFPELLRHTGKDLIVTDGKTLLGADDKAGIAEIITAMEYLKSHPDIKHGEICIAFTPDEEIGRGADKFDVAAFNCHHAYTVDGGEEGELEYENFNAASAKITFKGRNVHPGYAKNKLINSQYIACQFIASMPPQETPEHTQNYEGFYHLTHMAGTVDETDVTYLIRDHDRAGFENRKQQLVQRVQGINAEYGDGTATICLRDQYYNMRQQIESVMHIVDIAREAMQAVGVSPQIKPIRGGTDGARLSFMGLPCPNLFAGGMNFHGRYEFIPVQSMEKAVQVLVKIAELTATIIY